MRTFFSLLGLTLGISVLFSILTFVFFRGQIKNAVTPIDYLHYAIGSLTTSETGDMVPTTDAVQLWTSLYVLVAWVFIVYLAINHISNLKLGRFG
jgi:hypothetical protein